MKYFHIYFREPLKENYNYKNKKPVIKMDVNNYPIKLFSKDDNINNWEIMVIETNLKDDQTLLEMSQLKSYFQSIMRLTFYTNFKFSDTQVILNSDSKDISSFENGGFKFKFWFNKNEKPTFNEDTFKRVFGVFSKKGFCGVIFIVGLSLNPPYFIKSGRLFIIFVVSSVIFFVNSDLLGTRKISVAPKLIGIEFKLMGVIIPVFF